MIRTTLAGLRAHKFRLVATALAIVLGVGFVAGTLIFGDTSKAAMFDEFARAARNVDVAVSQTSSDRHVPAKLPESTVDQLRAVPGVADVDGRMQEPLPLLDKRGRLVGNGDSPGLALSAGTVPGLRPYDVTAGRVPTGAGEAALDTGTAARTGYAVGDTITVLDIRQERHPLTLVGIVSFGTSKQYANQAVVVLTRDAMVDLTGATGYAQVVARAAAGVPAAELARRVGAALPGDRIVTGAQFRDDLANDAIDQLSSFLTVLLVFAVIACVVSAFVIYNTFNILIAQRIRELALLRCVGASRGQVFGSVVLESVAVGLTGALLGVAVGVGIGLGLSRGAGAFGAPLPSHAVVLTATPVIVAVLVGVLVTVAAALVPALRATRVAPLAALRVLPLGASPGARRRVRLVAVAILVAAAGTALTVAGGAAPGGARVATVLVVVGGMVNFLAVLILSPLFVGPLSAALGALPGRVFGIPARLAVANARRNPGRTAATTAALMIGVGLMSAASVALATVKTTATDQLTTHYPVDYVLQERDAGRPGAGIPPQVAQRLRGDHRLDTVAEVRLAPATLDGRKMVLGTIGPAGHDALLGRAMTLVGGSATDLRHGRVILYTSSPAAAGKKVGDSVRLSTQDGRSGVFTVAALAAGSSLTGDAVVVWDDFAALHSSTVDDAVAVRAAPGVDPAASRAAVEAVTDDYPLVTVLSIADWRAEITSEVDSFIAVVAALLAIAIIIALIGIMNTLSLSVLERTRESAVLRALGLTRGALRATLLAEALLMGVVGALVGVAFGLLYGWVTTRVLFTGFAAVLSVPVGQLAGYVALAAVAAVVAAVLPARRAARAPIVAAMAES
jgi:putative ABC transport system permease protein